VNRKWSNQRAGRRSSRGPAAVSEVHELFESMVLSNTMRNLPSRDQACCTVAHGATLLRQHDLTLYCGDAIEILPRLSPASVQAAISSPPYWGLKDYGTTDQLGHEATPQLFIERLTAIYRALRPVLRGDGTLWLNLGDSYITNPGNGRGGARVDGGTPNRSAADKRGAGLANKNLVGIPWRVALAMQDDGWILRSDVIWEKPNVKPDGAKDRPTVSHEYLFLFARSQRYVFNTKEIAEASRDGGARNRRTVWRIPTRPYRGAHFACWPPALADLMVTASTNVGDTVLDPFFGAGTTCLAARELGRRTIGIEVNPQYCDLALKRLGYQT